VNEFKAAPMMWEFFFQGWWFCGGGGTLENRLENENLFRVRKSPSGFYREPAGFRGGGGGQGLLAGSGGPANGNPANGAEKTGGGGFASGKPGGAPRCMAFSAGPRGRKISPPILGNGEVGTGLGRAKPLLPREGEWFATSANGRQKNFSKKHCSRLRFQSHRKNRGPPIIKDSRFPGDVSGLTDAR